MGNVRDELRRTREHLKKFCQRAPIYILPTIEMAAIVAVGGLALFHGGDSQQGSRTTTAEVSRDEISGEAFAAAENELRNERLVDGSLVALSPGTRMQFDLSGPERRINLTRGQARFTVAKDPARPFIVRTDLIDAIAVGTSFTVRASTCGRVVEVHEGVVQISGRGAAAGFVRTMRAGQSLELAQNCPKGSEPASNSTTTGK